MLLKKNSDFLREVSDYNVRRVYQIYIPGVMPNFDLRLLKNHPAKSADVLKAVSRENNPLLYLFADSDAWDWANQKPELVHKEMAHGKKQPQILNLTISS